MEECRWIAYHTFFSVFKTSSLTQWTWVWANSGRWRRTWKPSVWVCCGPWGRRVGHYWVAERQQKASQRASLVAQTVKNLPTVQENWAQSLAGEDPLEKEMATHFCILAWRIPWTEEPVRLQSIGLQRVRYNWNNLAHTHMHATMWQTLWEALRIH